MTRSPHATRNTLSRTVVPQHVLQKVTALDPDTLDGLTLADALTRIWDGWTLVLSDHTTKNPEGFVAVLHENAPDRDPEGVAGVGERRWLAIHIGDTDRIWSKRALRYRKALLDHTHHQPTVSIIAPTLADLLAQFAPLAQRVDSPWVVAASHLLGCDLPRPAHTNFADPTGDVDTEREAARCLHSLGANPSLQAQIHDLTRLRRLARTDHASGGSMSPRAIELA